MKTSEGRRRASRRPTVGGLLVVLLTVVTVLSTPAFSAGATTAIQGAPTPTQVQTSSQPAAMDHFELHFRNYFRSPVYVAIAYLDASGGCDDYGGWATRGWWKLNRGQEVYVVSTKNRKVAWYAESENRTVTWSGTYTSIYVDSKAFDSCLKISPAGWRRVGMRQIDMGPVFRVFTQRIDA